MSDLKEAAKSFWRRPEGKTAWIFLAAAAAGGAYLLFKLLPFIIQLLANTLYAGVLVAALVALTSPIWNTRVRTLTTYMFKSAMRAITSFFVNLDPIGIIENYVADLKSDQNRMESQIANLRGVMENLATTIEEQKQEEAQSMRVMQVARDQKNKKVFQLKARAAGRLKESNLTLSALHSKLEKLYKFLLKLKDISDTMVLDMEDQVKVEKKKRNAMRAAHSAFTSAMNIIKGRGTGKELYDLAMENMAADYGQKMGEINNFMEASEGFIASVDLDNLAFEQEALDRLEEMEKSADEILFSTGGSTTSTVVQEEQSEVVSLFARR